MSYFNHIYTASEYGGPDWTVGAAKLDTPRRMS